MCTKVGLKAQYMHAHVRRKITSKAPNSDSPKHAAKNGQGDLRVVAVAPDGPAKESGIRVCVFASLSVTVACVGACVCVWPSGHDNALS